MAQLDPLQAHQVAAAVVALLADSAGDSEHGPVRRLAEPLAVELRLGTGRHATARFVRVRGEWTPPRRRRELTGRLRPLLDVMWVRPD